MCVDFVNKDKLCSMPSLQAKLGNSVISKYLNASHWIDLVNYRAATSWVIHVSKIFIGCTAISTGHIKDIN